MKRREVLGLAGAGALAAAGVGYATLATTADASSRGEHAFALTSVNRAVTRVDAGDRFQFGFDLEFSDSPPDYWRWHRPDGKLLAEAEAPEANSTWTRTWGFPIGENHRGEHTLVVESGGERTNETFVVQPELGITNLSLSGDTLTFTVSNDNWMPNYIRDMSFWAENRFHHNPDISEVKRVYADGDSATFEYEYPFDHYDFEVSIYDGVEAFTATADFTA